MTITVETQAGPEEVQTEESAPEQSSEQKEVSETGADKEESKETEAKSEESKGEEEKSEPNESEDKAVAKEKPKKSGFQRRIDKLNAKIAAKEAEIERLKRESDKTDTEQVDKKVEKEESSKPKLDDYDSYDEFTEAVADWKAEQKVEQKLREYEQKLERSKLENEQKTAVETYQSREKEFAAKHDDYHEVISEVDHIPLSPALVQLIVESENGPELAYELAKNEEYLTRINSLKPQAIAREIGRFEAKLTKSSETKPEKKITKAPAPIAPVGSKGGSIQKDIYNAENMSQREWEEAYRKARSS